ncbi:hypothetical protein [Solibacillus sp. FSL K6-1554]|uniref:hypothetical protein n=1 Tax=Solibacillus sp. FSL K6-1554 TaxID=2921472 RepID=UPI0030F5422E
MKKRVLIVISASALLVIEAALIYIVRGSEETQTFANSVLIYPPDTYFLVNELNIYSEKEKALIPVTISKDDTDKLTELMITTEVSKNMVEKPPSAKIIVEQTFTNSTGGIINFTLHQKNNNYYVSIPTDIYIEQIEWYSLKSNEIPEFYFELLEKSDL